MGLSPAKASNAVLLVNTGMNDFPSRSKFWMRIDAASSSTLSAMMCGRGAHRLLPGNSVMPSPCGRLIAVEALHQVRQGIGLMQKVPAIRLKGIIDAVAVPAMREPC
jgi:hypothetical protein